MPERFGIALLLGILVWIIGFIWGSIVFMTPSLKSVSPIPYVSSNPAISFPILVLWLIITYLLAKSYLKTSNDPADQGIKLGLVLSIVNVGLDLVVLVILLKAGFGYFVSLSVWIGYLMLIVIPLLVGRSLRAQTT